MLSIEKPPCRPAERPGNHTNACPLGGVKGLFAIFGGNPSPSIIRLSRSRPFARKEGAIASDKRSQETSESIVFGAEPSGDVFSDGVPRSNCMEDLNPS